MNRKSMGEIINKLLLFNGESDENLVKKKMDLLLRVLEELKETKDQYKYECICSILESDFYNKSFVNDFMKEAKFIEILYNILDDSRELPKKEVAIMKLLIRINENILKNINGRCTPSVEQENPMEIINMFNNYGIEDNTNKDADVDMEQIIKNIMLNLFYSLDKNKFNFMDDLDDCSSKENSEFKTTYLMNQRRMGMKKLAQIELFRTILDIIVNGYGKCNMEEQTLKLLGFIKEKKLFGKINKLFFEFPFCNLYQAYYSQIIEIALNELSPKILIETVFEEKSEKEEKNLIQTLIDNSLNNMKFNFESNKISFHPNFSFEVSLLTKIFASTNEHLKNLIKDNKNLEVYNKVLGDEVKKIFDQKLLLAENDVQFGSQEEQEEKKPSVFFGKRTFMDLMEQDIGIYKIYMEGGDYQKAFDEKIENEKKEQEELEKELEEKKKTEEEGYFNEEEEQEDNKKGGLKDSLNILDQDEDQDQEQEGEEGNEKKEEEKEKEENDNENENKEEEKVENTKEESSTEDNDNKDYNDVNYWKPEISPNDDILDAVLNDLN